MRGAGAVRRLEQSPARESIDSQATFDDLLRKRVRQLIREELADRQVETDPWVDQDQSALGRKQHCRLVREGALEGSKIGRKVLVRRSKVDAFIEAHRVTGKAANETDEIDTMLASIGWVGRR